MNSKLIGAVGIVMVAAASVYGVSSGKLCRGGGKFKCDTPVPTATAAPTPTQVVVTVTVTPTPTVAPTATVVPGPQRPPYGHWPSVGQELRIGIKTRNLDAQSVQNIANAGATWSKALTSMEIGVVGEATAAECTWNTTTASVNWTPGYMYFCGEIAEAPGLSASSVSFDECNWNRFNNRVCPDDLDLFMFSYSITRGTFIGAQTAIHELGHHLGLDHEGGGVMSTNYLPCPSAYDIASIDQPRTDGHTNQVQVGAFSMAGLDICHYNPHEPVQCGQFAVAFAQGCRHFATRTIGVKFGGLTEEQKVVTRNVMVTYSQLSPLELVEAGAASVQDCDPTNPAYGDGFIYVCGATFSPTHSWSIRGATTAGRVYIGDSITKYESCIGLFHVLGLEAGAGGCWDEGFLVGTAFHVNVLYLHAEP